MRIVVFWIEAADAAAHRAFGDAQLADALRFTEALRGAGKRHVTISSELGQSIGKPGVDAVEGARLPGGAVYDFDKRQRGGARVRVDASRRSRKCRFDCTPKPGKRPQHLYR